MRRPLLRAGLLTLAFVLALCLSACSKSETSSSDNGGGTAASTQLTWDQGNWNQTNWQ